MSFLMSESPVEAPVEEPVDEAPSYGKVFTMHGFMSKSPVKESPEEVWDCIRTMETEDVKVTLERKRLIPISEEINAVRNVLLNDPLLDPVLAQKIREAGSSEVFSRLSHITNEQIKERFRQPLEYLNSTPPFPVLAMPPPFKDIPSIDRAYYEGMLAQARDTFEVCMEQLKYVMNIGNEQVNHYAQQAEALKDDPTQQTEYQAQWTKADELHRSLSKINKVIREMHSSSGLYFLG